MTAASRAGLASAQPSETLLLFHSLSVVVRAVVVIATAGVGDEVVGLAVEGGGGRVVTHLGVHHPGALEAIDDLGILVEQSLAGGERLLEVAVPDEVEDRVR